MRDRYLSKFFFTRRYRSFSVFGSLGPCAGTGILVGRSVPVCKLHKLKICFSFSLFYPLYTCKNVKSLLKKKTHNSERKASIRGLTFRPFLRNEIVTTPLRSSRYPAGLSLKTEIEKTSPPGLQIVTFARGPATAEWGPSITCAYRLGGRRQYGASSVPIRSASVCPSVDARSNRDVCHVVRESCRAPGGRVMTTAGRGAAAADAVNVPEPPPMPAANNGGGDRRRSTGGGTSRDPAPFQGRENWRLAPHGTNDYNGSRMSAGGTAFYALKRTVFFTLMFCRPSGKPFTFYAWYFEQEIRYTIF